MYADVDTDLNLDDFLALDVPTPGEGDVLDAPVPVPEPGTWALMGAGFLVLALGLRRHSRRQKTSPASVAT